MSGIAPNIHHLPTREGYDRWSSIYDSEGNPLIALEEPRVYGLLGDVGRLRVADVGCGTGRHAINLAQQNAIVTALDFSQGMLDQAKRKAADLPITFLQHDLGHPLPLPDQSFDRVVCGLVLEHIANLNLLFAEMARICRCDGFIVVSAMHPAMMLRGVTARFVDPNTGTETRPQSCNHQISDFVMAAKNADLVLDSISEHAMDEVTAAKFPRGERYVGWPMLLMMRLSPSV